MNIVDTHCHLNFNSFDEDRDSILERALQAGVSRILIPGIDVTSSKSAVALSSAHDLVYAAIGVHPNDGASWEESTISALRQLVSVKKVVAIGEIGLDYYREFTAHDQQKRVFRMQLELAAEFDLPVIIHSRMASDDLLGILEQWFQGIISQSPKLAQCPGVLHSFSGDSAMASRAMALNFLIGITGPITYKKAIELHELVKEIPLSSLLIETDAPFLTPHPYRGQRNEPAYVRLVAEKIATIKGVPLEMVAEQTTANASRLFDW